MGRRLVALVAALVATLLGSLVAPVPSSTAAFVSTTANYAYDSQDHTVPAPRTTRERGPPVPYNLHTAYDAVGHSPHGASASPEAASSRSAYDYDDLARFVQTAHGSHGAEEQVGAAEPGSAVVARSDVAANGADDLARLTASQQKSLRSLQRQAEEHRSKLDAYRRDPDAFDNLGYLERAPSPEIRQRIIDGRIRHLENEINTFQDQIDKLLGGG